MDEGYQSHSRGNAAAGPATRAGPTPVEIEQDRFRAAVRATQGVLWTNDPDGRMTGEQAGWSALTGQTRAEYEGFGWASAVHPDDAVPTIDAWNAAVHDRRPFIFEHRVRRHDGAWRTFAIRAIPVLEHDGRIREWVGVHSDITALRGVEARLRASNEELSRYTHMVSHDLRAPLVNIIGFTTELEASLDDFRTSPRAQADLDRLDHDIAEALKFIRQGTERMDRLLGTILRIAREGGRKLTPAPIDLNEVVNGIVRSQAHQIEAKTATVTVASLPIISVDRSAVEQVIGNIFDNALKYADPRRPLQIAIAGEADANRARLTITDTGRGIARADYDRIFQIFRRLDNAAVPGEGVGLAYVQALIRAMGGTIAVESTPGHGSTFTVELPVA